jgi:hypothetical protein
MGEIIADVRLQTGEREPAQGHVEGVITGTGPLPDRALAALEASASRQGTEIAGEWVPLSVRRGGNGTATADFLLCGVRLVPGRVSIAERGAELEVGWLAYGTLVAVSGRLRWDDEPR